MLKPTPKHLPTPTPPGEYTMIDEQGTRWRYSLGGATVSEFEDNLLAKYAAGQYQAGQVVHGKPLTVDHGDPCSSPTKVQHPALNRGNLIPQPWLFVCFLLGALLSFLIGHVVGLWAALP